jgi:broad specificity phosphatase PhoE
VEVAHGDQRRSSIPWTANCSAFGTAVTANTITVSAGRRSSPERRWILPCSSDAFVTGMSPAARRPAGKSRRSAFRQDKFPVSLLKPLALGYNRLVLSLESLIMVRHGESTGNVARTAAADAGLEEMDIPQRDVDVPLSENGRAQAVALGHWLAALPPEERPTLVLSSPYLRALETARISLAGIGSPKVRLDERLRDRELGSLYGLTPEGVAARFPQEAANQRRTGKFYYRPPGGESWADVALRLRVLLADLDRDHPGERVLVFAHDVVIVLARYILENLSEADILEIEKTTVANCSVTWWINRGGTAHPVCYNDLASPNGHGVDGCA